MKVGSRAYTAPATQRRMPEGLYTGPAYAPVRPGALDAFRVPSIVAGKQVAPPQLRAQLSALDADLHLVEGTHAHVNHASAAVSGTHAHVTEVAAAPATLSVPAPCPDVAAPAEEPASAAAAAAPVAAPTETTTPAPRAYSPRAGSYVARVLDRLQQTGGHLTYADLVTQFGLKRECIAPNFDTALRAGALVRLETPDGRALALPGYVPPTTPRESAPVDAGESGGDDLQQLLRTAAQAFLTLASAFDRLARSLPQAHKPEPLDAHH